MKSRDNSVISQPNQAIVDAYGTSWSIVGNQVAADGVVDDSTNRVTQLAYAHGRVWQENTDNLWWSKGGTYDATWNPPGGSPMNPLPQSPDNTVISQPGQFLVDASGTTWTVVNSQVAVNGIIDAATNRVTELAYANGTIWQENTDKLWWSKDTASGTWNPPGGTSTDPVHNVVRGWYGGNGAFGTDADWSGAMVPQPGDTAIVRHGHITISPGDAIGINFLFDGTSGQDAPATRPKLSFIGDGPHDIGMITMQAGAKATVSLADQLKTVVATTTGIHLSASLLDVSEYQGVPFTVNGDSSLTKGASLSVGAFTGGEIPASHFVNNGTMSVDASSASLGALSGQGTVRLTNNANLSVLGATAGETIQLQSGHLDYSASRYRLPFLASITDFGANSLINLGSAHVLPENHPREVFKMSGPTSGELFIYEGTGVSVDLHISGQSHIYASYGDKGSGAVVLTAHDTGNSIPIASS